MIGEDRRSPLFHLCRRGDKSPEDGGGREVGWNKVNAGGFEKRKERKRNQRYRLGALINSRYLVKNFLYNVCTHTHIHTHARTLRRFGVYTHTRACMYNMYIYIYTDIYCAGILNCYFITRERLPFNFSFSFCVIFFFFFGRPTDWCTSSFLFFSLLFFSSPPPLIALASSSLRLWQ